MTHLQPVVAVLRDALYRSLSLIQQLSFLSFPFVSSVAFSAWPCRVFDDGSSWLVADYAVQCYTPEWNRIVAWASVAIVIHVFAIPLILFGLLVRARDSIGTKEPSSLAHALSFLHAPYEAHSYAWEYVETSKKVRVPFHDCMEA